MSAWNEDEDDGIGLSMDEMQMIISQLADAAGDDGISRTDLERQAEKAANIIFDWMMSGVLYQQWREGKLTVKLNEHESDLLLANSEAVANASTK